jgi:hypothetical protein
MQTLVIDTYKVIKRLQERGFTKDQAEALVSVAQEIDLSAFVTKADLRDALRTLEMRIYRFLFAAMSAQAALIVALIQLLK